MYWQANAPHHNPHFHAYYHDDVAVLTIDPVELIAGSLPRRQQRLVEAWAELHQQVVERLGAFAIWPKAAANRPATLRRRDESSNLSRRII